MEGKKKTAKEKYSSSGLRLCNKWHSYSEFKIIKHTNYNVVFFDFFKSIFLPNYKPVLEGPHMQTIQVFHADKNPFLGLEHWEVCLCCFLKWRTILQRWWSISLMGCIKLPWFLCVKIKFFGKMINLSNALSIKWVKEKHNSETREVQRD